MAIPDEVTTRFNDLIARRVLTAGSKLPPERELAAALGVSRPSLRQALKALQILGVIRCRQGDGCYLASSTTDIMKRPLEFALALKGTTRKDLFETRQTIEVRLAGLAAERRTEEDCDHIRNALAAMKDSMGIPAQWIQHEMRFHDCIMRAAKNEVMTTIMEMLSRILIESRRESVRLVTNYEDLYRSHEMVFVEIEKQDAVGASRAMAEHFATMESRAKKAAFSMDAELPTPTETEEDDCAEP
jgi:GntR family transcriptional repressor for pyruvate dehydrogenase complex